MSPGCPCQRPEHTREPFAVPADVRCSTQLNYLQEIGATNQTEDIKIRLEKKHEIDRGMFWHKPGGGRLAPSTLAHGYHKPSSFGRCSSWWWGCVGEGSHFWKIAANRKWEISCEQKLLARQLFKIFAHEGLKGDFRGNLGNHPDSRQIKALCHQICWNAIRNRQTLPTANFCADWMQYKKQSTKFFACGFRQIHVFT